MTAKAMPAFNVADWHGKLLVDLEGQKIGKLQDVYVDVETDVPQFATVKEGFIGRHLTFVPLAGIRSGPRRAASSSHQGAGSGCAKHRTARRGALPSRRVRPLPPLRAQLHAAGHRERPPTRLDARAGIELERRLGSQLGKLEILLAS